MNEFNKSLQNSNYDECSKKIGILEDLEYSNIDYLKGIIFYSKGNYEESISCLKKINKHSKTFLLSQNLAINNYILLGKYFELDYTYQTTPAIKFLVCRSYILKSIVSNI